MSADELKIEEYQPKSTPVVTDTKDRPHRIDPYIWGSYIALLIVSVIELFSASSQEVRIGNIYGPIIRHVIFLAIGFVCMLAFQRIHFSKFDRLIPIYVLLSIGMMIWVLFGGTNINGVKRAVDIAGFTILPAEFLKLAVALGVAWILSRTQTRIDGKHDVTTAGLIACMIFVLFSCLLLFNQGLTNTLLLMGISMGTMLIGGVSWKKMGIAIGIYLVLGGSAIGIKMLMAQEEKVTQHDIELAKINQTEIVGTGQKDNRANTWMKRIERHFNAEKYKDPITDENKQEQYSYIAQARGGLIGVGIGNSRETSRLPLAFSDYIYAIVIEELGAIFAIFVLALYLFLLGRAGRLAMVFKSTPPCLLVMSCALFICLQALFHICIVVGVFPVSGQPLPLISKGGTSIITTSMALGVMLSASRWAARKTDSEEDIKREISELKEIATDNPSQI